MSYALTVCFIALGSLLTDRVWADVGQIGVLSTDAREARLACEWLEKQRRLIVAQAESLSTYIDSLKATDDELEELHEALRASLGLVQQLVEIDHSLDRAKALEDSLTDQLRIEYDWEIGVLIQQLQGRSDSGLLTQLMVYQEAREALGMSTSQAVLRYDEGMDIEGDDGPDEIRQKLELMEDLGKRLERDVRSITRRLSRLEESYRLRLAMQSFIRGQQGRQSGAALKEALQVVVPLAAESEESRGAAFILRAQGNEGKASDGVPGEEMLLEIHKWKVRLQEVDELKAVVRERSATFRKYLHDMLRGPDD